MALAEGRDKLSALLLIVGMAAVALGVRAWPHRFLESRPLARQERGWMRPAREAPAAIAPAARIPVLVITSGVSQLSAKTSTRNLVHRARQAVIPPAPPRTLIDRETPAALLPSRPLMTSASIISLRPTPPSSVDPSREHVGEALGRAFASAGRRTARAFTRAF